jgi:hypothetical protein
MLTHCHADDRNPDIWQADARIRHTQSQTQVIHWEGFASCRTTRGVIGIVNAPSGGVIVPEKEEERRERYNQPGIRRTSE